jgi:hypothetical protein
LELECLCTGKKTLVMGRYELYPHLDTSSISFW